MPNQNISQYFSECIDFIHKARVDGGNVLVHCLAGVSRSASIVVAYVMTVTNLTFHEALDAVRGARRCASPNFGFQRQLLDFERERLQQERSRLRSKYGESKFDDQKQIQVLLTVFRQSEEQLSRARAEHYAASQRAASNYSANGLERFTLSDSQSGICVGEGDPSNVKTEKSSETGSPQLGQAVWEKTCTLSNDCNTAIGNTGNGNGENGCRLRQDDIQDCAVSSSTECGLTGSGNAASSPDTVVTSLITNMQECRVFEKSAVQVNDAANDLVSNADAQVLDDALKVAAN